MTFLNAILLGGILAGAIPVIIHIINRNRFKRIQWGAMHLIEQILRRRRRRLKIEQILLLLVRIAIPVLLALCMARPVLTGDAEKDGIMLSVASMTTRVLSGY